MAPIALTDAQLTQVLTTARAIPRALRDAYLQRVADALRGRDFGDGDVHRACVAVARAVMTRPADVA